MQNWQLYHHGGGRAVMVVKFDVPTHPRLMDMRTVANGLGDALAGYLVQKAKPRWRRIWEAIAK